MLKCSHNTAPDTVELTSAGYVSRVTRPEREADGRQQAPTHAVVHTAMRRVAVARTAVVRTVELEAAAERLLAATWAPQVSRCEMLRGPPIMVSLEQ